MNREIFEFLQEFILGRSGLVLTPDKTYLLETRLLPVARRHALDGIEGVARRLQAGQDRDFEVEVVEAMTTNESLFFRDMKPFEVFSSVVIPNLVERRGDRKKFRIWSAACSSGQEPYSLSMLLGDIAAKISDWDYSIIATDISHDILAKARSGLFTQLEVQRGLPVERLVRHFTQEGEFWKIRPEISANITFNHFNLLDDPAVLGGFDVVFCRNVLIYFDVETKKRVMEAIADNLSEDGVLFLGGSESTMGVSDRFMPIPGVRGVYRKSECENSLAG